MEQNVIAAGGKPGQLVSHSRLSGEHKESEVRSIYAFEQKPYSARL